MILAHITYPNRFITTLKVGGQESGGLEYIQGTPQEIKRTNLTDFDNCQTYFFIYCCMILA